MWHIPVLENDSNKSKFNRLVRKGGIPTLQPLDPHIVFTKNLAANQINGFACHLLVKNPLSFLLVPIKLKVKIQENNCIRCIVRLIITHEEGIQNEGVRQ
jgi:hypothetical protein